ncbi:2OG-Fe(II) oxygenase [Sphingomonas pokkalii]|uniref:Prolyl 4-hydroxylase alpha subunit Fe(2+) 2OG dioxygenase domain-containing protein n=1 Tax=Sphingomonas pokkalii TaxID=2175090 RepID=A0A2U0SC83_9SPHN|nr:2OG-Fe(II) oxygenase [Sphingomonas pokkalii]PVX28969.1 hypothetical protein DD559_06160 [Sphingomonas pokkalii]
MNDILVLDHVLGEAQRQRVWEFLDQPGWKHGAYSSDRPDAPRYSYKHFAGYQRSAQEDRDPDAIGNELAMMAPVIAEVWRELLRKPLKHQMLSRCYANSMPAGVGGGVHQDSDCREHLTAIYYPQAEWCADQGGETLFFSRNVAEVIKAVVPKPDRLVVFPGTIPHVARPIYGAGDTARITLMFKTLGRRSTGIAERRR